MADNPFDAFDDSARPSAPGNPFDALDDDAVVQKRVAENPDLQAVMSRFARSRVDDISATARRVPDPEAFTSLDDRTRGKAVQGELQAAEEVDQRAQAAVRDAQARGDSATYGAAVEAASEAGRRLAQARKLDEDNRAGIVRQASPEQQLAIGNAIAAQKKRIDYLNDQIEQADSNPAFLPEGRRIEDVRADLQREMQALYKLEAGRGYGEQRQAFADPSAVGEFGRGVARGALGTVPEMLGGAAKQAGADGVADVLRDFGRGVRRDTAAEAAGEILKLGEKESFGKDLKNFVSAKFGEGLGTSLPIIAAYMAGGPAGTVTGVSASAALGIGQMRNSLEDAFAEQGIAFPEEHAARYVYMYGTAIGALESLTEVTGMRALTGDAKRQVVRSIGRALAAGAARGAAMEGVTEALQEAVELYGVADATGKPMDYAELRRRMTEGFAAGAVPGAAFGAFTGAASNKAAFDIALEKAKELGFGDKPEIGANESEKTADAAPLEPAASPPEATAEQPATADAAPAVVVDPVGAEQAGTAALDVVDSLIPDGTEVDREMAGEAAAVVSDALGLEVADPADESAAAQQAAEVDAEEQADAITLDAYLAEGGSLSRSALPTLARRMGVTEADLPALLDKAVDAGTLRKTAGGMYRRAAAEPQAAPSEFRQAERQRRAMEAIDEALNFGRQILPKDVTIEVADSLNVGGYELDALSDSTTGRIALAVYANNPRARIGHEGLHTLVTRGHVSPGELAILAETARTSGVWTAKAEAQYRDAYAGRANLDGLIAEEAAAHLVEARIRGQDFGQQANAIIEKIKKVLQRIRKALQGRGFKTADDVIDALMSGEMARREARAEWMRDAQAEARQLMQVRARQGGELPGGVRVQGVPLFAIRAFHGSPHDFDRFDMSKIGTGEGAQAYGRGLYFAENEGVARSYRDYLSKPFTANGARYKKIADEASDFLARVPDFGGDLDVVELKRLYNLGYFERADKATANKIIQAWDDGNIRRGGRMYEVRINADPEDFLDWDKPLSEQSEKVREMFHGLSPETQGMELYRAAQGLDARERPKLTGDTMRDFATKRGASEEVLKNAGIPGIRYLDQGSRTAGDGSRNYVVFDDALIEIVAKDGVPVVRDEAMFALSDDVTPITPGLDMSQDARMARAEEMGFDTRTVWYHGTRRGGFKSFSKKEIGSNFAADERGFFFINDPKQASEYATSDTVGLPAEGGSVIPAYLKMRRPLIVDDMRLRDEGMQPIGVSDDVISFWDNYQGLILEWADAERADGVVLVDNSYRQKGPNKGQPTMMAVLFDPRNIRSVNAAFDPAKSNSPNLLYGLSDIARRFLPSRNEPLAGINSIVRDLAHDLGITVRQGLTTPAAKTAKRQARRAGTDISSYFDPATGVLRVTSMSDLTAILTHAGEAIIRRYDAAKGRADERGARDVMNPLERLISRHAFGLLGTYRGKLFGQIEPKYSGMHLAPVLRETLTQYLQAWHNANVATMNRSRDPGGYAKAQRELTNAQRMVARYMGRKLTDAIAMEKASVTSVWGLVQGKVDIAEIRDYVDIRYNQHSKIKPPPPADPLDRETQRAAFGKWFTTYISDRPAAEAQDPALFEAFEDLIDTTDPVLSAKLDDASDAIAAYAKAEPVQIVTSMISSPKRFGNIASFFQNIDRDGLLPTLADGARMLYRGGWDDLHPWYTAVRQLLETHRVNSGVKIDLDAADNAYKLLRLGRHSGAWAGRDLEDGIKARASNAPEGPSLVQALQMALGSDRATALDMGQDGRYAQFNAYLIARRAVRLWDRFYDGTLPNPPLNASRETAVATIQKLEGEFPSFVGAADMVYEFQTNLLKLQRDAGILTPETFETLAKEPDYVPFIRDMTDKDEASSRVLRGAQSIIRKIKGSDRNIMDPIATIAQKVYETRQIIATNDAKLALLKLAEAAGPGGGAIAERLDPNTSKAMRVNLKDALRNAADELGVSRADANALVELAQELLGDQMTGTVFGKGQLNTTGQNITWVYENGIPVPIKLADGDLGNLMMQTLQTFGNETTNIIVEMMAVPAAITRSTVTAHPSFILRNGFVDGLMAWMYDRQATPWVTQAKGFVAGLMETEKVRAYARSAGLMGGPSTSALDRLRFDRDVRDLVARGYNAATWKSPHQFFINLVSAMSGDTKASKLIFGSSIALGTIVAGPTGGFTAAVVAGSLGAKGRRAITLASEASETGTRARLYELAYNRAIKSGLNPREAAAEAAFYAHDYMDYSRHGSTVAAWSKLVPFMNAALQGMDRYARLLVAKGDYGSAWLPYLNYRLGRTETLDLTEREKAELAQSAQAWMVSTLAMGGISMAVSLIWAMRGDDDLQDVPQEIRATHWVIPIDGVYHLVPKELPGIREALKDKLDGEALRLPKGFDNAWFANLIERLMIDARQSNPRWFENYLTDLSSILNPPMEPQAIKLFYEMKTGKDFFSGRDIIPKWKQERFPEMMWDEYTSEFAKWAGKKTGTAPYYIDHALKQLGTSWARDAMSLNVPGLPWYDPTKPEKSMDDYFIARRFLWKIGKGSEAAGKVREIMGPGDPMQGVAGRLFAPYSRLDAAAETYKEYLKRRDPASGSEFLDRLRPPERAYAILDANVEGDNAKMKMVHPVHRADKVLTEVAGVQKEILGNLFESRKRKKNTGELIPLNPSEKRAAIDILTQYKMMEAHNALVVAGETGYAQRALFDTSAVMEELRAAVPDVAEEFEKRLKKAKVLPFRGVREQWPQLRQVLESAEVTALSKGGDKRGVAAKVREFYALAKTAE